MLVELLSTVMKLTGKHNPRRIILQTVVVKAFLFMTLFTIRLDPPCLFKTVSRPTRTETDHFSLPLVPRI